MDHNLRGRSTLGNGNSKCRATWIGMGLVCSRKNSEASVGSNAVSKGRMVGCEFRVVPGTRSCEIL